MDASYRVGMDLFNLLERLSPTDRLRLLAFDAEFRRGPRALVSALWAGVDALEGTVSPIEEPWLRGAQPSR